MKCEKCINFDGYDPLNQRIIICDLYGEITTVELIQEPCETFKENLKCNLI